MYDLFSFSRCGSKYCVQHCYPGTRGCSYDFKTEGRKFLGKNNYYYCTKTTKNIDDVPHMKAKRIFGYKILLFLVTPILI